MKEDLNFCSPQLDLSLAQLSPSLLSIIATNRQNKVNPVTVTVAKATAGHCVLCKDNMWWCCRIILKTPIRYLIIKNPMCCESCLLKEDQ